VLPVIQVSATNPLQLRREEGVQNYPRPKHTEKKPRRRRSNIARFPEERKEEAMIARFDHRPVLMFLALATVVCVLMVALTLFVSAQAVPTSGPSVDPNAAPSHWEIVKTMLL